MESWEQLRQTKNYREVAGTILFQKLFKKSPQAKVLFGFPIDIDTESPDLLLSKRFMMHACYMIEMLDTALQMLGPDIELLTEIMIDLGSKHVRYGVQADMFPAMGEALIYTLEHVLKDKFTEVVKRSWEEIYKELSADMILGQSSR